MLSLKRLREFRSERQNNDSYIKSLVEDAMIFHLEHMFSDGCLELYIHILPESVLDCSYEKKQLDAIIVNEHIHRLWFGVGVNIKSLCCIKGFRL